MLKKLSSKNPMDFSFVRYVSVIDPILLHSCLFDDSKQKLQRWLNDFIYLKVTNSLCANEGPPEFIIFNQNTVKLIKRRFRSFEKKKASLVDPHFKEVEIGKYKNLASGLKLVLMLSHGQTSLALWSTILTRRKFLSTQKANNWYHENYSLSPHTCPVIISLLKLVRSSQ